MRTSASCSPAHQMRGKNYARFRLLGKIPMDERVDSSGSLEGFAAVTAIYLFCLLFFFFFHRKTEHALDFPQPKSSNPPTPHLLTNYKYIIYHTENGSNRALTVDGHHFYDLEVQLIFAFNMKL